MRQTEDWVLRVLDRPEAPRLDFLPSLGRVLITGGEGSVGSSLKTVLEPAQEDLLFTDKNTLDVRDERNVMAQFIRFEPTLVIHLAASKHAPLGEEDPYEVIQTNVEGTRNILNWCERVGARCIVTSTCKACDPETAYGASKLIAERMALNAGQLVVRYYNVVETSGNVFRIWEQALQENKMLAYTDCSRRFISLREALDLTLWVAAWADEGRYTLTHTSSRYMRDVLSSYAPSGDYAGQFVQISPRRGDRVEEPRHAASEHMTEVEGCEWISRVWNNHDPLDGKEQ